MSGPTGHPDNRRTPHKFQIASRLGGFRNTVTLSDPLGTSARFIIARKGSSLHKQWAKTWMDTDPIMSQMNEEMVVGEDPIILTPEEEKTVQTARDVKDNPTALSLLPIIDRLIDTTETQDRSRTAIRKAVESGRVSYSDARFQGQRRYQEEALFLISWEFMPDEDGDPIPASPESVRELLENDTPLEDAGLDDLLLAQPCATITIPAAPADPDDPSSSPSQEIKLLIPGLTLGRFYSLWAHWVSDQKALFRDQLMDAAGKNSLPPSDPSSSSGGGTNSEELDVS